MEHEHPDPPLPLVQEAELDEDTLAQLFEDIGSQTELLEVVLKGRADGYAGAPMAVDDPADVLARTRLLLKAGGVAGVQLRYRYEGAEWWDTLLRTGGSVRLVRIRPVG